MNFKAVQVNKGLQLIRKFKVYMAKKEVSSRILWLIVQHTIRIFFNNEAVMTYPTALLRSIACCGTHFGVQNFIEQLAGPRRHEGTKFHKEFASCVCSFVAQKIFHAKDAKWQRTQRAI